MRGDGRSGGIVRSASLIATSKPGTLQIRLVDPATDNKVAGLGACTGDSGGPVFEHQNGRNVVVGVVSWSTAPNNAAGCGGLTGTTPLSLYRGWVLETMKVGSSLLPAGAWTGYVCLLLAGRTTGFILTDFSPVALTSFVSALCQHAIDDVALCFAAQILEGPTRPVTET